MVGVAVAIIMTPAAYHRIAEQTTVSGFFIKLASWLIAAAMVPLMTAITLEAYIVGFILFGRGILSVGMASGCFVSLPHFWFGLPFLMRRKLWIQIHAIRAICLFVQTSPLIKIGTSTRSGDRQLQLR
jgi:hypothetical protein